MWNSVAEFNFRLDTIEERISELEDSSEEIRQNVWQSQRNWKYGRMFKIWKGAWESLIYV